MREFSSPLSITIPSTGNLTDDVVTNGRDFADTVVFSRRTGDEWSDVTAAEFLDEVQAVAKGLVAAGVEVGDRVALLSKTRYEWTLLDYAIWFAGAVTVPIYETSSAEQIGWILAGLGRPRDRGRGPGPPRPGPRGPPVRRPRRAAARVVAPGQRGRRARPPRLRHLRRRARAASYDGDPAGRRHADLHQRHDRQAQGLHAHPRQLHVRARRRGRRAARALRQPTTPRPCSSCRSPTSSRASSRSAASRAGPRWATAPTSRTW